MADLRILKDWGLCVSVMRKHRQFYLLVRSISVPACLLVAGPADVFVSPSTSGLTLKLQFCLSLVDSGIMA